MKLDQEKFVWMLAVFFIGVAVGVAGTTLGNRTRPAPIVIMPPEPTPLPAPTATPGLLRVFVNGQVAAAAVYELAPGSIVNDAIRAAGGFTTDANTAVINLAQSLSDGAHVYVPAQDEVVAAPVSVVTNPEPMPAIDAAVAPLSTGAGGLININTATLAELDTLPGVGPATAQKIIDHRNSLGPFATIEAIMDVSGIGPARFSQMKDLITVGGE